jgi:hypothetical protein
MVEKEELVATGWKPSTAGGRVVLLPALRGRGDFADVPFCTFLVRKMSDWGERLWGARLPHVISAWSGG